MTKRRWPPTNDDVSRAERCVEVKKIELEQAEQQLDLTTKARDAAVQGLTANPTSEERQKEIRARVKDVRSAAKKRSDAKDELMEAEEAKARTYYEFERSRRWLHGLALSANLAHSASDRTIAGGVFRYLHRFSPAQTFELGLGYHDVRQEKASAATLRARLGFGRERTLFFVGAGGGTLDLWEKKSRRYAALGEVGIMFRVGHHTHPNACCSPFSDARLFVMPWLPFDGRSSSAVLFGLELGGGFGFINASAQSDGPRE